MFVGRSATARGAVAVAPFAVTISGSAFSSASNKPRNARLAIDEARARSRANPYLSTMLGIPLAALLLTWAASDLRGGSSVLPNDGVHGDLDDQPPPQLLCRVSGAIQATSWCARSPSAISNVLNTFANRLLDFSPGFPALGPSVGPPRSPRAFTLRVLDLLHVPPRFGTTNAARLAPSRSEDARRLLAVGFPATAERLSRSACSRPRLIAATPARPRWRPQIALQMAALSFMMPLGIPRRPPSASAMGQARRPEAAARAGGQRSSRPSSSGSALVFVVWPDAVVRLHRRRRGHRDRRGCCASRPPSSSTAQVVATGCSEDR